MLVPYFTIADRKGNLCLESKDSKTEIWFINGVDKCKFSSGIIRLERRPLLDTPEISVLPCLYLNSSGTPKHANSPKTLQKAGDAGKQQRRQQGNKASRFFSLKP